MDRIEVIVFLLTMGIGGMFFPNYFSPYAFIIGYAIGMIIVDFIKLIKGK